MFYLVCCSVGCTGTAEIFKYSSCLRVPTLTIHLIVAIWIVLDLHQIVERLNGMIGLSLSAGKFCIICLV